MEGIAYLHQHEIVHTIAGNQVVLVSGETGCGKTTQVRPQQPVVIRGYTGKTATIGGHRIYTGKTTTIGGHRIYKGKTTTIGGYQGLHR